MSHNAVCSYVNTTAKQIHTRNGVPTEAPPQPNSKTCISKEQTNNGHLELPLPFLCY